MMQLRLFNGNVLGFEMDKVDRLHTAQTHFFNSVIGIMKIFTGIFHKPLQFSRISHIFTRNPLLR